MGFLYVRNRIDFSTKNRLETAAKKGNKSENRIDLANSHKFLSTVQIELL
jgi:hypothetical protein